MGFTQPSLVDVTPWIRYEAQNMAELSFIQELQCIKETEHLRYIIVMIVWFKCWKQDQGWWLSIPTCSFQVGATATVNIKTKVLSIIAQVNVSQGESQVLRVLTTLYYLAEVARILFTAGPMLNHLTTVCCRRLVKSKSISI